MNWTAFSVLDAKKLRNDRKTLQESRQTMDKPENLC